MVSSSLKKSVFGFLYILVFFSVSGISASAATISIDSNGNGSATITITADGAANLAAIALDIDVDGAVVTSVSVDTANFNIYPDAAYSEELGDGYTYGEGTPVCGKLLPGEIALPQSSFALCFANLNGEATAGADGAVSVQVTITVSEGCNITICENATRGGLVAVDGTALDADCVMLMLPSCCDMCQSYNLTKLALGAVDNLVNVQDLNALVNYVNTNKTGALWVVNSLNPAWNPVYNLTALEGGTDTLVNVQDLNTLVTYVNNAKTGALWVVNCNQ